MQMLAECVLCPFVEVAADPASRRAAVITAFVFGIQIGKSEGPQFLLCAACDAATRPAVEALNAMPGTELADPPVQG
jgi:hypothetical protein